MSSKIDGVPRELLNDLLDSARLEVDERIKSYGEDYRPHVLVSLRKMVSDAEAILAAHVVERQPYGFASVLIDTFQFSIDNGRQPTFSKGDLLYFIEQLGKFQPLTDNTFIRGWKVGTKYFGLRMEAVEWIRTGQAAAHGEDTKLMPLYFENHSPELAELQAEFEAGQANWVAGMATIREHEATIARLTAENERIKKIADNYYALGVDANLEIERLKGGQGEPVSVAPEGWKLAPIEATRPMLRAFIAGGCSRSRYRDMIAAAPILESVLADRSTFVEQLEKDIDIHGNYLPGVTRELLFDLGYRKSAPPAPFEFGWDCKSNDGREHRVIGDYCVACLDKVKELNQ